MEDRITESEIKSIAQSAAREAVREMMREFGLHDEDAPQDIHELRNLLGSWRTAKKTIFQTIVRATTTFALGALALGAWLKFKGMK
jgi:hypothetical protein